MIRIHLPVAIFVILALPGDTMAQGTSSDVVRDTSWVNAKLRSAEVRWKSRQFTEALEESSEAFDVARQLGYDRGAGMAKIHHGVANYGQAAYKESLENFNEALLYLTQAGEKKDEALVYHWLGNSYYRLNQYEKALTNYLRSLKLREELGDEQGIAFSFNNIANIYLELRARDTALSYYKKALEIFQSLDNQQGVAYALGNIGRIYKQLHRYPESLSYTRRSLSKLLAISDKLALTEAYNQMASIEICIGKLDDAEKNLTRAHSLAQEMSVEDQLVENYLQRARLDSAKGDFKSAFSWSRLYDKKKESLFNIEKSQALANMQASFELEKKDHDIAILSKQQEMERRESRSQRIIFVASLGALAVVASILIFFLKQKQKSNRLLQKQKQYADELSLLKDRLFSIISHDLRAPLNTLTGVLHLAAANHLKEEELRKILSSIGDNTQNIIHLLENLLNWSRGHLKGNSVKCEAVVLNTAVHNVIRLLKPVADQKQIQLTDNLSHSIQVMADEDMLELVLRNLISNAIKFTPALGHVTINCELQHGQATIAIQDTGIGIPSKQIHQLFGMQNFSTAGTANEKGCGLGLILCHEFVEKNGGTIWVKSSEASGSVFYFTLPLAVNASVKADVAALA